MYILGINAYHADVSAVLIKNGELIAALEEERFRRIKHCAGFPAVAIAKCLEIADIEARQIEHIAISRNPRANSLRRAAYVMRSPPPLSVIRDRWRNFGKLRSLDHELAEALGLPLEQLPRLHYVEHHPAHLASTFFVSPFEAAAICAIDAFGDFVSTSTAEGAGRRMRMLDRVFYPHSLGILYTAITQFLGFRDFGDEFKVMGLGPYGEPEFVAELRRLVELRSRGRFKLNLEYFQHHTTDIGFVWGGGYPSFGQIFSPALSQLFGPARTPGEEILPRHANLACSLQQVFEECVFHVLNGLWERTRQPRLCLAGGCALNSVTNGKVRSNTAFTELFVQPAAADNGTALGAAYYVWHELLNRPRSFVMQHGYWGTQYSEQAIGDALTTDSAQTQSYCWRRVSDERELCRQTAQRLADGQVVGWYQGRMEWGARALGNRSILADPRRADMRDVINARIKQREKFRPFAPAILESALSEYFVAAVPDPFMVQVYPVREDKRDVIPAVTHIDGSGRLQTVSATSNPRFAALIEAFAELTGVPVLLNTSFNENEPIVDTPAQALDCFLRTGMDALVMNDVVVERRGDVSLHQSRP